MQQTIKQQAAALVAQMTVEEKAALCSGQDCWNLKAIERLGLFLDGLEERRPLSLERDVLSRRTDGGLYAYRAKDPFIDIGTPEALARASGFVKRNDLSRLARDIEGDA